jgi:hypothetical protein
VLWSSSLAGASEDLQLLESLLARAEPTIKEEIRKSLAARLLLDAELTEQAGVDRAAPIALVPGELAGTVVITFGLLDRPKFLAWLQKVGEVRFVPHDGVQAAVLTASGEPPWACITHEKRGFCQLGAGSDDAPLALLSSVIHANDGTKPSPAIRAALEGLGKDARTYGVFDPGIWVDFAAKRRLELERQKNRFEPVKTKRALDDQLKAEEHRWRRAAKALEAGAFAIRRGKTSVELEMQVGLTSLGTKSLDEISPKQESRGLLERWSETPALLHGLVQLDPHFAAELLGALEGPKLPLEALDGSIGLLVFGVDCECEAAKKNAAATKPLDWAFLFPSAFAIGLTDKAKGAPALAPEPGQPADSEVAPAATAKRTIVRSTPNGHLELQVLEDALVYSAGPGSAAAAVRRFNSLPPLKTRKGAAPDRDPRFSLTVHLKSIDAALSAGSLGFEHRSELLMFEALRLKARPLIETIDEIQLEAEPSSDRRRAILRLTLGRPS